jgi:hypothetical protein
MCTCDASSLCAAEFSLCVLQCSLCSARFLLECTHRSLCTANFSLCCRNLSVLHRVLLELQRSLFAAMFSLFFRFNAAELSLCCRVLSLCGTVLSAPQKFSLCCKVLSVQKSSHWATGFPSCCGNLSVLYSYLCKVQFSGSRGRQVISIQGLCAASCPCAAEFSRFFIFLSVLQSVSVMHSSLCCRVLSGMHSSVSAAEFTLCCRFPCRLSFCGQIKIPNPSFFGLLFSNTAQ